ncbi:probable 2-oxoglutarate-dependent dioxygenase ANS isoform X1 [Pistacia vera]|uniref:probable 2-oxoglutarate-dependent dioxygenase ANS isoform X1 n=1 Tax=Pistacia vera TaxID=55513 RepID=UPI001262BEEF|nr:probable 2-oxoglutarate-dependent dioxygenase ANS isoform X1 [Pistacia vera]
MEAVTRVQNLAESKLPHVPAQYIQPLHDRPTTQNSSLNIPVIDLSTPVDFLRGALCGACREWGAFHVTNHSVPLELLRRMRRHGRSFFEETPMPDKLKYSCDLTSAASEGYGSKMLVSKNDTVLDWRDYFDHHTLPLSRRNPRNWPEFPSDYRRTVEEYSDQMNALAERVLGLISESLGLKRDYFKDLVGEFYQNITVSYYPACPQPELTLGLQSHSDFGVITLLIQDDVGGLQVLKDGEWVTVEPLDDAIVVLLSDQTQVMTNGEYISAIHRAITNANKARLSVATFHDPAKTVKISPASELVSESSPRRYHDIVYGDYVSSWYTKGPEGKWNLDALLLNS